MRSGSSGGPSHGRETALYEVRNLSFRYPGADRAALRAVDVTVSRGSFHAIIGPNGCGKTTLLRLMLGALQPGEGTIAYDGRPLPAWPPRALARRVGVVPQNEELVFPVSVRELVAMGRYPHLGAWRGEATADRRAIDAALETCDVAGFRNRPVDTLSGGERQRARMARALAQEPETLVLDEPTASLDISHEMGIFELLRELVDDGVTVVMVTHNLNVAARYADQLLLLDDGRTAAAGEPERVLTTGIVEAVYDWPVARTPHPGPGPDAGTPQITPLRTRRGDTAPRTADT